MNIEIDPLSIIDILSICAAFMLGLLFISTKSKNNRGSIFLGLFLWSLAMEVFSTFIDAQQIELILVNTNLLTLPLLFVYVIKTLNYRFKWWHIALVVPFLVQLTGVVPYVFYYAFNIFILVYTLKILTKHKQELGDFYSEIEDKILSWIKMIVYIYLAFHFFWIIEELVGLQSEIIAEYFAEASTILTLIMIYWVGRNGFSQPQIFNLSISAYEEKRLFQLELEQRKKEKENKKQYEQQSIETFELLTNIIAEKKLFLQKDITIRSLSRQLNIPEKEFSKLINTHTKKNFYHYINQFRVEEFKRLLNTSKVNRLSLLGLSDEAGFNSKSTFYSAVKFFEGVTPKQYLELQKKSE